MLNTQRHILFLSMTAFAALAFAPDADAEPNYRKRDKYRPHLSHSKTSFDFSTGLRLDQFDWNIASDPTGTNTPNILSELTWEDITVFELRGHLRHVQPASFGFLRGGILLDADLTGGFTVSGDNQDSDYLGDNRTLEFSRSNNDSGSGFAFGGSAAIGYQFNIAEKVRPGSQTYFTLTPLVGYSWERQKYRMREGHQTIPVDTDFPGLDSEYRADWFGPFYGIEAGFEHNRHLLTVRGEEHTYDYDAEAIWNLRTDFMQDPSYTHEADGDGFRLKVGYSYAIDTRYDFTVDYDYTDRKAEDGVDTTFFSDGTIGTTRLNEVNETSHALRAGLKYYFDPPQRQGLPPKKKK